MSVRVKFDKMLPPKVPESGRQSPIARLPSKLSKIVYDLPKKKIKRLLSPPV